MQLESREPLPLSRDSVEMSLYLVVNESLVHPFKYWHEGIQLGIHHNDELYTFFQSYLLKERLKAYAFAHEQTELGLSVCLTVSKTHYSIWCSLRSISRATSSNQPLMINHS